MLLLMLHGFHLLIVVMKLQPGRSWEKRVSEWNNNAYEMLEGKKREVDGR